MSEEQFAAFLVLLTTLAEHVRAVLPHVAERLVIAGLALIAVGAGFWFHFRRAADVKTDIVGFITNEIPAEKRAQLVEATPAAYHAAIIVFQLVRVALILVRAFLSIIVFVIVISALISIVSAGVLTAVTAGAEAGRPSAP